MRTCAHRRQPARSIADALAPGELYDGTQQLDAGQIPFSYQSMVPGAVTVVNDPLGGNFKVMRYAVADGDRPYPGATNPRADFETPALFSDGSDLFASIKFMIPAGFPTLTDSGFFQIAEIYGPPHGGSPPIGIDLFPGAGGRPEVGLQRDSNFGYDRPWTGPTLDTGWHTIYLHTHMAPDDTGSVQLWFDGAAQTFTTGSQTINYPTLASGINWDGSSADVLNVNQYREAGAYPGTVVTYQAAAKVGTTLASVEDTSSGTVGGAPISPGPPPAAPIHHPVSTKRPRAAAAPVSARFCGPSRTTIGRVVTFAATDRRATVRYDWKNGRRRLGARDRVRVTFHSAGIKHVTLVVHAAGGATSVQRHRLVVSAPPCTARTTDRRAGGSRARMRRHRRAGCRRVSAKRRASPARKCARGRRLSAARCTRDRFAGSRRCRHRHGCARNRHR